jgi:exonuclease III
MRIVTWNCQGAYRKKAQQLSGFAADLVIIQECECPAKLRFPANGQRPTDLLWQGDNPDKGVGVFAHVGDLRYTLYEQYNPAIRHCIPIQVSGAFDLHLLAIWAMGHPIKARSYVGQLYAALQWYADFIREKETIIIGDWNSNAIWDRERAVTNHSAVIELLDAVGLVSIYHTYFGEAHGQEQQNTFFLHRIPQKGYHLDYCVAPKSWLPRLKSVEVGAYEAWSGYSDHMPLFVEFTR